MDVEQEQCKNPRAAFYKKRIQKHNYKLEFYEEDVPQELRRKKLLEIQKKNRDAAFNIGRKIIEDAFDSENEGTEQMEIDTHIKSKFHSRSKAHANQLMMSEWMFEVPQDFSEKWITVPCPIGKRTLLVACKGSTKAYSRQGFRRGKFYSGLPGGNRLEYSNSCTILDCIWMAEQKMFYVLDILAWSNQPFLNCDTEFRFFWLKTHFNELPDLSDMVPRKNTYPILRLPNTKFDSDLSSLMTNFSDLPCLDGILFYHSDGHYTKGRTPLVTWLKSFMIPEMLGMSIPAPFDEIPNGYIDLKHYIDTKSKKQNNRRTSENSVSERGRPPIDRSSVIPKPYWLEIQYPDTIASRRSIGSSSDIPNHEINFARIPNAY